MGVLCREHQRKLAGGGIKSAKVYLKNGKKKFVGTNHLKTTESGTWWFLLCFSRNLGTKCFLKENEGI